MNGSPNAEACQLITQNNQKAQQHTLTASIEPLWMVDGCSDLFESSTTPGGLSLEVSTTMRLCLQVGVRTILPRLRWCCIGVYVLLTAAAFATAIATATATGYLYTTSSTGQGDRYLLPLSAFSYSCVHPRLPNS